MTKPSSTGASDRVVDASVEKERADQSGGAGDESVPEIGPALAELRQQVEHGGFEIDALRRQQIEASIQQETIRPIELQKSYRVELAAAQQRLGQERIDMVEAVAREIAERERLVLLFRRRAAL